MDEYFKKSDVVQYLIRYAKFLHLEKELEHAIFHFRMMPGALGVSSTEHPDNYEYNNNDWWEDK